jgi:pre-60S factor REI1
MVAFHSFDLHRQHYQTEWHRFNLNRRVRGLPPVTEAHHDSTIINVQEQEPSTKKNNTSTIEDEVVDLEKLLKDRLSTNKLDANKHCLFCPAMSDSFEAALAHMSTQHGLYIPDQDFMADLPGLVQYLLDKVCVGYCLYCADGKAPFNTLEAVRRHMDDKGHQKIRFDEEGSAELADFYDWSSLQDGDGVEHDSDSGCSEYEDCDDSAAFVSPDGTELCTATGARIGNRAYFKYYRQYLRPVSSEELEAERQQKLHSQHLVRQRGQRGQLAETSRQFTPEERRDRRVGLADRLQEELALGVKANKFQPYYRLQIR